MSGGDDLREGGVWTRRQRWKNDAIHAVVRAALAVACAAPRAAVRLACRVLGMIAYATVARARRRARARLARLAPGPVEPLVREAFLRAGDLLADTLALLDPGEPADRTLALDPASRATLRDAFDEGRGVVFLSAHLGPWERMAALLAAEGFPVATIARESYDPRLTRWYERLRTPRNVRSIYRGRPGAAVAIVRELARGRSVGFLVDLPGRVPVMPIRWLGEDRDFPVGPARVALARRAAVVVGTASADGLVHIERVPSSDLGRGPDEERALAARVVERLGRRVEASPTEWIGLFA